MTNLLAAITFILGTAIGSFLSVVVYRLNQKHGGIVLSRSICHHCRKKIKWQHLIPVFSWIFLRGKCAYCGKKISVHYLMLELLTGGLFLAFFLRWNFLETIPSTIDPSFLNYTIDWQILQTYIFYIIETGLLMSIFFYDLMHKEIPDKLSFPAIVIALSGGLLLGNPSPLAMLIGGAGILVFFLLQFLLSKGAWIGGGDIRLGLLTGLLLGWEKALIAIILAYFIGAIFSLYLLARRKVTRKSAIPFGPFIITGIFIALFYGQEILDWYLNTLLF